MNDVLKIGNGQGFWGDQPSAPRQLVERVPDLDVLTLDYLAEVSLSIMAIQRAKRPDAGFARDFLDVVGSLAETWRTGRKLVVVANAGGLNPRGCGIACRKILAEAGVAAIKVGVVTGDDVTDEVARAALDGNGAAFSHLDTGDRVSALADKVVSANAYMGANGIAETIGQGAQLVVTGRVADPSLVVGPCVAHFGWNERAWNERAGATVAGHLIECGTQVSGGIATDWPDWPDVADIGFPVVEVAADGSCVVTKPAGSGGRVDVRTVKEQLLYELGDPARYLSPDVTASFLGLKVDEVGVDRVCVTGALGGPPPDTYKVSACYRDGFTAAASVVVTGRGAETNARRAGNALFDRLRTQGVAFERTLVECLGTGDSVGKVAASQTGDDRQTWGEVVLRLAVADANEAHVDRFTREIAGLVTCGPQGLTGYATGRASVRPVFGYWPTLVSRAAVAPTVEILD